MEFIIRGREVGSRGGGGASLERFLKCSVRARVCLAGECLACLVCFTNWKNAYTLGASVAL